MKLQNKILVGTALITAALIYVKALVAVIPVIFTGSIAFLTLVGKAYVGRKIAKKLEEYEEKIL